ncbi:MAG: [protein-PII] uridylyltransferase [Ilumatobacter sp.]|uniref:[protein-PII] uridylyltransferase n=1 Tax=Ilumatobacter sp. TaxID=1967498 RepID=UPI0039188E3A
MTPDDRSAQLVAAAIDPASPEPRRGRAYCQALSTITDEWVIGLFEAAMRTCPTNSRVAILAAGGYGRGELAPYSDLDLLLVHDAKPRKVAKEIEPIASAIWYPVWDAGVKLGHAVRRVDEQLDLVDGDLDSATALLTARFLAGDRALAEEVIHRGRTSWEVQRSTYLTALHGRMHERQAASADVAYRLEPDLKAGHGGLRDVQTVWWAIASGLDVIDDDLTALDDCYDTLLRARVALHQATGRPGEIMRLEDQDAIATVGGWSDADALMADVAAAGRRVSWVCDETWSRAVDHDRPADRAIAPGVLLQGGEIRLAESADPVADPTLALQAAVAAARNDCRIARSTLDRLHAEIEPWPGTWPVGARDELVALLLEGHRAIKVLESLDQRELVSRFLPEWEPVRSKPQRNAYHRFTVDRHLWEAAANAAELADGVARPDLLVIGALFHDIGKGYPGDHTDVGMDMVRDIAPRLGFGPGDVDALVTMVEHHLLLPDVAMRRDLTDAATIDLVAGLVGSVDKLELLHALTEADSKATGVSAWGSWKEELVEELVSRTRHVLGGGNASEVTWRLFPDEATLERMALGEVDLTRDGDLVTIVSPDTPGSFSQVAGVLSLHGLDVLTARAHSDEHGMAASQFRVSAPAGEINWRSLKADLRKALDHELAIEARLVERAKTYRRRRRTQADMPGPPKVKFIEGGSSNATVIEVRAVSKIGILHRITKALAELGLDIRHATVHTIGMEVVDTFYVRTRAGGLVTSAPHRKEIQKALLHAVR